MILVFCFGLLSALFAPSGWKILIVFFWSAALMVISATQALS
ncbi:MULTISPECIES: hypothetical protein [unclassified Pseudomonas]|nr:MULTISPECIES: hypothetical protein [unclassified Pseudomonas]MDH0897704.1 hypothetical protein [Pseudomonas sp. GD03875]MDH1067864.1 hypothetical protein [Pseudomonas sp. GD03985]